MLELTLADGTFIQIESRWSIHDSNHGAEKEWYADEGEEVLKYVRKLIGVQVLEIRIDERVGGMVIKFANGIDIRVPADVNFEAWNLHRKDGTMLVSLPGGEVSKWLPSA